MPQITITLSDQLYEKLATAVEGSKLTGEDFILLALEQKITSAPPIDAHDDASYADYLRTGLSVPATEILEYYKRRLEGKNIPKPAFRKMRS